MTLNLNIYEERSDIKEAQMTSLDVDVRTPGT